MPREAKSRDDCCVILQESRDCDATQDATATVLDRDHRGVGEVRAVAIAPVGGFFGDKAGHRLELIGQTMVECRELLGLHQPHRDIAIRTEQL